MSESPHAFLADEGFNRRIVGEMRRKRPNLDILTIREAGKLGLEDPLVLELAAEQGRVLLSHDTHTMPDHLNTFLLSGRQSPGVVLVPQELPIGPALEDLLLIVDAGTPGELANLCTQLPL